MSNLSTLSDVSKEIAWHCLELPDACYDDDDEFLTKDVKLNIMQWLDSELAKDVWKAQYNDIWDDDGFIFRKQITAILFKRKEDAVFFATVWF